MASYSTLEVFTRFGTDAFGLERTLRMVQAFIQILISFSFVQNLFFALVAWASPPTASHLDRVGTVSILRELRSRVAVTRRFFRFFRFLDSFQAAYKLLYPARPGTGDSRGAELWLDVSGRSFNGMYLLLEASTLAEALAVPGLSVWGPELSQKINVEAQRFWFFALLCGIATGLIRLVKLHAYAPVPETGEGFGDGRKPGGQGEHGGDGKAQARGDSDNALEKDHSHLKRTAKARREEREALRREARSKSRQLLRRLVADTLDLAIPGVIIGWISLEPGTVGVVLAITTYLTSLDVWERCKKEVIAANSAAVAAAPAPPALTK
ncbi:hypothetical protein GQ53DRAFT_748959 [Thozetella sp. PMI_491]|nr:hypothetical protein GQ53DRAFT_748959 [Thozetella sp. PMI_491]